MAGVITVRFPSGFSVQYNSLNKLVWDQDGRGGAMLYGSKPDGTRAVGWSVHVPADCLIEFTQPCRTYSAAGSPDTLQAEVAALRKEVRSLTRKVGKDKK